MLKSKMTAVIDEVNSYVTEREELVHCIALALLTKMNLFVLGGTGQAKSYAIDLFRERIEGARQFEVLMSKEVDREELFGRLDLASIIPGNISKSKLMSDSVYKNMYIHLTALLEAQAKFPADMGIKENIIELRESMEIHRKSLAELYSGTPEINMSDKIPDSHIVFLDEIFKSADGILNSLLKALNERRYTNEGIVVDIPVISFFSASNEIPCFNNPEEKILRPLYDRFQLKVVTQYVDSKENRRKMLEAKQKYTPAAVSASFTLDELRQMQQEVRQIIIPPNINELMDAILCELRSKKIHVSDRTFFDYGIVVQAEAWLSGGDKVTPENLKILVNYLWSTPEEIPVIREVIERICENPLGDKVEIILAEVYRVCGEFDNSSDKTKALGKLRQALVGIFDSLSELKSTVASDDTALAVVDSAFRTVEDLSKKAHGQTGFTYLRLSELKALQNITE